MRHLCENGREQAIYHRRWGERSAEGEEEDRRSRGVIMKMPGLFLKKGDAFFAPPFGLH